MKKSVSGLVVLAIVLFGAINLARGQATEKTTAITDDLSFTVGNKLWVATWKTWAIRGGRTVEHSTTRAASLPSAAIKYKDFFLSAGFFFAPIYHWSENFHFTARRWERDVNLGYFVHPRVAVTLGYKGVHQNFEGETFDFNGPTAGLTGNLPIGNGFALYGNAGAGYLFLHTANPQFPGAGDAPFAASEAGVAYRVANWPLSFTAGYKFQYLGTHLSHLSRGVDATQGAVFGINFSM